MRATGKKDNSSDQVNKNPKKSKLSQCVKVVAS